MITPALSTPIITSGITTTLRMSLVDAPSLSSMTTLTSSSSGTASALSFSLSSSAIVASSLFTNTLIANSANNKYLVGSMWIISSAILTTYSTTRFLKYQKDDKLKTTSQKMERMLFRHLRNHDYQEHHRTITAQSAKKAKFSRASLLTLYRFSGSLFLGLILHSHFYQISKIYSRFIQTLQASKLFLLPSLFLFAANFANSVALDRIGISLTYTSKCGIPLITVLLTLFLDGVNALPSKTTLLSLIPIAFGIGAASWNTPTFELFGFLVAVFSTTSQAALNVVSKRVMRLTGIKGAEAQRAMVLVALSIWLIMACTNEIGGILREWKRDYELTGGTVQEKDIIDTIPTEQTMLLASASSHPPLWLTLLAVIAYHMEYVLSFMFVGLVEPITYGTCDALRRLLIIVTGRQLFGGDAFSKVNIGGIGMALLGALMYSITSSNSAGGIAKKGIDS